MIKVRKVAGKIEIIEGEDTLPEGKVVTFLTFEDMKRVFGLGSPEAQVVKAEEDKSK